MLSSARIRERCVAIGMGIETLGAKVGLSGQTMRKLEYGSDHERMLDRLNAAE
ncbi:MAG: hypothetical protein KGL11_06160 [Alphaproteobacteria bacterium]|nr:hypothetical protein [Alphaproteobacteria bacterium]